jgi:hypothetical protein
MHWRSSRANIFHSDSSSSPHSILHFYFLLLLFISTSYSYSPIFLRLNCRQNFSSCYPFLVTFSVVDFLLSIPTIDSCYPFLLSIPVIHSWYRFLLSVPFVNVYSYPFPYACRSKFPLHFSAKSYNGCMFIIMVSTLSFPGRSLLHASACLSFC